MTCSILSPGCLSGFELDLDNGPAVCGFVEIVSGDLYVQLFLERGGQRLGAGGGHHSLDLEFLGDGLSICVYGRRRGKHSCQ